MPDFHIREANLEDAAGMAKVHVDTWRAAYQGIIAADFLAGLSYETAADGWQKAIQAKTAVEAIFVACREPPGAAGNSEQGIVGIVMGGPERSQDPYYQAEIYCLYVLPEAQNRGLGRRLIAASARRLVQQLQAKTLLVWVLAENPYRQFYEALGGKQARQKSVPVGTQQLLDVGYGWDDLPRLIQGEK
jgi:ribosomal protein S18 acetylase RimI-like enzyme